MSSLLARMTYIIISLAISNVTLHLLRKKGRLKRDAPASIGLFIIAYTIIHFIVCFAQGCSYDRNLLILILFFVAGVVILGIWGIKRRSLDTK